MLDRERIIDIGTVVKYGKLPQRGVIRTRKKDKKDEIVIEANGIGFAIHVPILLDFLKEAKVI